jgi:hypothetical protein
MGAVSKAVEDVGNFVSDQIIEPVVQTVEQVVQNPQALATVALAVAAPGLGTAIGSALGASGVASSVVGNAVLGGALSSASGGNFGEGALAGGVGSLVGSYANPAISEALGGGAVGNVGASALTGGALSELRGGDFSQGALTSGLISGIGEAKQAAITDYLQSIESPYAPMQGPTEADVLATEPSINNVIQTIAQPADFNPALYDVGKALVPVAVGSLLANQVMQPASQPSGFGIVSAPSQFRAPEYNMAFTPSAPINFGSPEMLKGTQWESPSLTSLINTLNQPDMSQYNQTIGNVGGVPMSINDIISNLGKTTASQSSPSIDNIIANIQSQYGQTT